ncbi:LysR family transcriptional regulator [Paraburkholderia sp. HD33-4]|uniref:LysR family transcriptional regulator n=1 Tax=Paraburkholderia sp. HD33-4 TaxID=2883242 RepID=UPI001F43CBB6|nr:LysR family transcriptional regulator [Paraburkholderia sp. HD33-4]
MDEFTQVRTFLKVVEAGSFSAAAREASAVSSVARQVKSLEDELGARLLNRNSRNLSLTEAGRRLYERATTIVNDFDSVKSEIKSLQEEVKGVLRVSLRVTAGASFVVPALPRLLERYPDLTVDVTLTDERRDLIANNIDVAIWLGVLPDAEIVARRISPTRRIVCGSTAYFRKHGVPRDPDELQNHQCIVFAAPTYDNRWRFTKGEEYKEIEVSGPVRADNGMVLLGCALADMGLVVVPDYMVRHHIADGTLMKVLGDYTVAPHSDHADLFAVYVSSRGLSRKVRVFVDFLVEIFEELN